MDASEPELMSRLARGDDLALNTLMDRWGDRVASFLYKMTGSRDAAVDLAQETFVKLYQARDRYRPGGNFSTYLFAIAANLARNHATVPELADPNQTPEEAARSAEKIRAVHDAFLCLPPDLREAMTLFAYEGMGYAEIATVSQCSSKAVETRIYRARQLLRDQLKGLVP